MFDGAYREAKDVGENPIYKLSKYAAAAVVASYGAKKLGYHVLESGLAKPAQSFLAKTLTLFDNRSALGIGSSRSLSEVLSASGAESVKIGTGGFSQIISQMVSAVNHANRETNIFTHLASILEDPSPLSDRATRNKVSSLMREYTRANSVSEAKKAVTSDMASKLLSIIGSKNFKAGVNTPLDLLNSIHSKIERGHYSVNKKRVAQRVDYNKVLNLLGSTVDRENSKVESKVRALFGKNAKGLTIEDLLNPTEQVQGFLSKLGFGKDDVENLISDSLSREFSGLNLKEKGADKTRVLQAKDTLKKNILRSQTGLVMTESGVVPLSMLEGAGKRSLFKTLNRLQVPLFPGVMNVPLTILNFNASESSAVKGLGRIAKQADLLRPDLDRSSFGISIGSSLLQFNPKTARVDLIEDLDIGVIGLSHNTKAKSLVESRAADGGINSIEEFFKGGDRNRVSKLYEIASNHPERFFEVGYHPESGFTLSPKNDKVAFIFDYLRRQGDYDYKAINPKQLLNFLQNNPDEIGKIDPQHLGEALFHILHSSNDSSKTHFNEIKTLVNKIEASEETMRAFNLLDIATQDADSALHFINLEEDNLLRAGSVDIYRAAQRLKSHPHEMDLSVSDRDSLSLFEGVSSVVEGLTKGVIGDPSHSALQLEMEKGVEKELIRDIAEKSFFAQSNLTEGEILNLATLHVTAGTAGITREAPDKLMEAYEKIGIRTAEEIMAMSHSLMVPGTAWTKDPLLNRSAFRKFTTAYLNPEDILRGEGSDLSMFKNAMEEVMSLSGSKEYLERQTLKFFGALNSKSAKGLRENITFKDFDPYILATNQFEDLPNYAIASGWNLLEGLKGLTFGSNPLNEMSYRATVMARSANNVLGEVGLGVNNASLGTVSSAMMAFGLTRIAPVVAGFYAWGMLNNTLDESGLPTIPQTVAGVLGPLSSAKSLIQEFTGLNDISKRIVDAIPSLDQYFTPKSFEEHQDYLAFGEDPIRSNRLWVLGNRSPIYGAQIEGFRPNYYNRWRSNWTNADNVLAFNPFVDWVSEVKDRPYKLGGGGSGGDGGTDPALSQGGVTQGPGGGSGKGYGLVMGEGQGGDLASSGYSELTGPADHFSLGDITRKYRAVSGFYGAFLRYNFAFQPEKIDLQVQDPGFATSIGRLMFAGRYGELTGPIGEFTRRFVSGDIQATDAINPLPNTMPEWLPDDLRCITKDTLVEIDGHKLIPAGLLKEGDVIRSHVGKLRPITKIEFRKMDPGEKLYKISVGGKLCFESKVSEEHPIWTPEGWKEVKSLTLGDWVGYPIPQIDSLLSKVRFIDIAEYIKKNKTTITEKWIYPRRTVTGLYTLMEYMEEHGIHYWERGQLKSICATLKIPYTKTIGSKARRSLESLGSTIKRIPRFLDLAQKDWAVVCGYYAAEGSANKNMFGFSLHEKETEFVDQIKKAVLNLWGIEGTIYQYPYSGKGVCVSFSNNIISMFLRSFLKASCTEKRIEVYGEVWKDAIRCFINGDGFYSVIRKRSRSGIKQPHNKNLCYFIWQILLSQKIVGSITKDGLDFKGYQAERLAEVLLLDKSFDIVSPQHRRRVDSNGHWFLTETHLFCKLRRKEEVPQEDLVSITVDLDSSFCLPGLATHNTGDPYVRTGPIGELELPGDAYERSHPALALNNKLTGKARYQSYDDVSKLEILARVAPNTYKYSEQVRRVMTKNLSPQGFKRVQLAREDAEDKEELYRLYPRRNVGTESLSARISNIGMDGEIYTDKGVFRLAGVKFSYEAYSEGYESTLEKFGISVGSVVQVKIVEGQEGILGETVIPAIINGVNEEIVKSHYASFDRKDKSPLSYKMMYGTSFFDDVIHSDNPISNKLLRTRDALEQFERGEVYGTDRFDWMHPIKTGLTPTVTSYIHRDMVGAAIGAMLTTSFFFRRTEDKMKYGTVAGAIVAGLSFLNGLDGNPQPESFYHDSEVDQYLDTIKYVKYSRIREAVSQELEKSADSRTIEALQKLKKFSEKKISQTMIGYDDEINSLDDAIRSLPRRQQQIAKEIILYANNREKEEFYDLLPDPQKKVLASYLGFDPLKNDNLEQSRKFNLPDPSWEGWSALVEDKQIETLVRANENVLAGRPGRSTVDKAKQILGENFRVPYMENGVSSVEAILKNIPNIKYEIQRITSDRPEITLDFDTKEEVAQYYRDRIVDQIRGPNF